MFKGPPNSKSATPRKNEQIRCPQVLLVKDGQKLGVYTPAQALQIARQHELDLVEIAPKAKPPVCSIMDYGKHMYNQQKKQKSQKQTSQREKEISFRYVIDDNDLQTKANQIKRFLQKGDRVKIVVRFKAREKAHIDQGYEAITKCLEMLKDDCTMDKKPSMEGPTIICRIDPKKAEKHGEEG